MKFSEAWLREWVNPSLTREQLAEKFTMSGLEVESIDPAADSSTSEGAPTLPKEALENDYIIDVSITPNRGDCLSIQGIARELSAITQTNIKPQNYQTIPAAIPETFPVKITAEKECPRYLGRVIRDVSADATTPTWMKARLHCAGVRLIHPIVDITNYVMLELGQPMHAFDLAQLIGGIDVRLAKSGEKLTLLDGNEIELDSETLVIADQHHPLAIGGVMGGLESGVTLLTKDIFLEIAFFQPKCIARQRQHYNLSSEGCYRFERGVDPCLQHKAMERATALILEITGGKPGPITEVLKTEYLPEPATILLRPEKLRTVLGIDIPAKEVTAILDRLSFQYEQEKSGWRVHIPSYRFDLKLEEDLIEEIARLYGFEKIPTHAVQTTLQAQALPNDQLNIVTIKHAMADLGYYETVTYSFIDAAMQKLLDPAHPPKTLVNPITADMTVMRTSIWPGLISALQYNKSRQQPRVRFFETGLCFLEEETGLIQQNRIAGLAWGEADEKQWGLPAREVDFFDVKGDLQNLFTLTGAADEFSFEKANHPALHPGQTAAIYRHGKPIGMVGALHPAVLQALDISGKVFVFECELIGLASARHPKYKEISKYPEIHRDLSIIVERAVPTQVIQDTIRSVARDWLQDIVIFDVYQGKGIAEGFKSIALSFVLQNASRTLTDTEVSVWIEEVVRVLKDKLKAELRS